MRFSRGLAMSEVESSIGAESASVARRARGTERLKKRMTKRCLVLTLLLVVKNFGRMDDRGNEVWILMLK